MDPRIARLKTPQECERFAKAARTWQSITRFGILETVERVVSRAKVSDGYNDLVALGLDEFTFEAVVIKYPDLFKPETVERAKERIDARRA